MWLYDATKPLYLKRFYSQIIFSFMSLACAAHFTPSRIIMVAESVKLMQMNYSETTTIYVGTTKLHHSERNSTTVILCHKQT